MENTAKELGITIIYERKILYLRLGHNISHSGDMR